MVLRKGGFIFLQIPSRPTGQAYSQLFEALDDSLAEYINHLYQEGDHISLAGWTISGLRRFFPRCRLHLAVIGSGYISFRRRHQFLGWELKPWLLLPGKLGRPELAILVFIGFAFFLRAMELVSLHFHHVRLFQGQGTVLIAIINCKTSKGLQQFLSLLEPDLVHALSSFGLSLAESSCVFLASGDAKMTCFGGVGLGVG